MSFSQVNLPELKMRVFLIIAIAVTLTEAANILAVFPTPSISHQVVFRALTDALEDRGHTLTIVSTDPGRLSRYHPNSTEIDMHFTYDYFRRQMNFVKVKESKLDEIGLMEVWIPYMEPMYKEQFEHPEIVELIKSKGKVKYDVVIVEYLNYYPWFALAEWFDAPLIGITSLDTMIEMHESFGNEANPIVHPEMLFPFLDGLTFYQRYRAIRLYLWYNYYYMPKITSVAKNIINTHMPGVTTSLNELRKKAELLMTNTSPALGFIRPVLPTTIQLGFLHIKPPKNITDDSLKSFLDNSEKPIIYMSLGSNVQSSEMNENFVNIFLDVFKTLPYNILWKWETDNMKNKPDNVFIRKWLPQADLLAHPKIKLFIMQGGQQSLEEAIDRGVPLIVIPFLGDQDANAMRVKRLKIGVHLELHNLSEENLKNAINEIVNGDYKQNVAKLRETVHDQPMTSLEKAVWWVEYCIRHKGMKHLDYSGKYVPFYQRYMLDFIAIAVVFALTFLKIISVAIKFFTASRKVKKE